jgi:hypothetical protein
LIGFYKYFLTLPTYWAARAPSTNLWSTEAHTVMTLATLNGFYESVEFSSKRIFFYALAIPKIIAWGGLITEIIWVRPYIPALLTEIVPP